jgi:hypothetical protein
LGAGARRGLRAQVRHEPEGFHAEELARIAIGFAYEGVKIIGDEAECIEVLLGSEELGFRTLDG